MKNLVYLIIITISFSVLYCGKDGADGRAFLKFSWGTTPDWYYDNNPSVPSIISREIKYQVYPGIYAFSYQISTTTSTYWYSGTYEIPINMGEKGSL